jgi:hypothetical protein
MCDQFVISIGGRVHIPLTARRTRNHGLLSHGLPRRAKRPATRQSQPSLRPAEIFGSGKGSTGTTVQIEPIYVVIPLRVDRCPSAACQPCCGYKLYRTEPAYPPKVGPCGPPSHSPPAWGHHETGSPMFGCLATFPAPVSNHCGGTTPHTPRLRPFGREGGVSLSGSASPDGLTPRRPALAAAIRPRGRSVSVRLGGAGMGSRRDDPYTPGLRPSAARADGSARAWHRSVGLPAGSGRAHLLVRLAVAKAGCSAWPGSAGRELRRRAVRVGLCVVDV